MNSLKLTMTSETSTKRRRDDSDSENEIETYWPRYLVMQASTPNDESLKKLSPFAISLGIRGIAGEPKDVRKINQGLLIEVTKRSHALNLLDTFIFVNIPVTVSAHKTLNSRKGVIRCRDLAGLPEDDICRELHDQHVTYVKRIHVERGKKATDTYILTFNAAHLPATIKVGYLNIRVDTYIPNPLRCFKCQMYGHGSNQCRGVERCSRCGEAHRSETCSAEKPHCIHCKTEHAASDRNCPRYMHEKLITRIKHTENISFQEARRKVETTQPSYATVAQAKVGMGPKIKPRTSVVSTSTQTDYYWPCNQEIPSLDPPEPGPTTVSTVSQTEPSSSSGHRSPTSRSQSCGRSLDRRDRDDSFDSLMETTASSPKKGGGGRGRGGSGRGGSSKIFQLKPVKYPSR